MRCGHPTRHPNGARPENPHCGLPVVATDCPYGPGEIITEGGDGLLVPLEGGADALADALWILMGSADRRRAMSARAREKAARYVPSLIAERYLRLFEELRPSVPAPRRRGVAGWLRDVRDLLRPPLPVVPTPAERQRAGSGTPAPTAGCVVAPDGSPVFELATDRLPAGRWDLVLRRRKSKGRGEVRLPLPPLAEAADGRLRVVLDRATHRLPEGRWDLYLAPRVGVAKRAADAGERLRLEGEVVEQGELLALPLRTGEDGVSAWIPYRTVEGNLSVRTWLRPAHAEVSRVRLSGEELTVAIRLYGAARGAEKPEVRAVAREDAGPGVACEVELLPAGHAAGELRFTVPLRELLPGWDGEQALWDLQFTAEPGAEPVLVSRIHGDAADRKDTDVIPTARIREVPRPVRIRPYYTLRNELALSVREIEETPTKPPAATHSANSSA